jgi:uncharacterized protein (TIGR00251 family)
MIITNMDIAKYIKDNLLRIKVVPNSSKQELVEDNGLKLYLKSVPDKDKANVELVKYFWKVHKLYVEIKSGNKSRNKVLRIL